MLETGKTSFREMGLGLDQSLNPKKLSLESGFEIMNDQGSIWRKVIKTKFEMEAMQ